MEEWHSDIVIDKSFVRMCLEKHFPGLASSKSIECIGEGWNNKVYLIDDSIVFKFPHRKSSAELIAKDNLIINKLPDFQGIKIPKIRYIVNIETDCFYSFRGYDLIAGKSAYLTDFSEQEFVSSLMDLALFLKKLHAIDEKQALALGTKPQAWDRTNFHKLIKETDLRIKKINQKNKSKICEKTFIEEANSITYIIFPENDKCLVHGDLDYRHLLFDRNRLAGIIDWDEIGINNRSVDLCVIWSFYPQLYHEIFFKYYGFVEENTWRYARFLGLCNAITLLYFAYGKKDVVLAQKSQEAIRRINSSLINLEKNHEY
ncbi:MAG: phosphotransferase family protein [Gammaproteobacteria bacterium]